LLTETAIIVAKNPSRKPGGEGKREEESKERPLEIDIREEETWIALAIEKFTVAGTFCARGS
jgi:hypothetical protein